MEESMKTHNANELRLEDKILLYSQNWTVAAIEIHSIWLYTVLFSVLVIGRERVNIARSKWRIKIVNKHSTHIASTR